nr:unnamed protein product [Callosobruchus analis]
MTTAALTMTIMTETNAKEYN